MKSDTTIWQNSCNPPLLLRPTILSPLSLAGGGELHLNFLLHFRSHILPFSMVFCVLGEVPSFPFWFWLWSLSSCLVLPKVHVGAYPKLWILRVLIKLAQHLNHVTFFLVLAIHKFRLCRFWSNIRTIFLSPWS